MRRASGYSLLRVWNQPETLAQRRRYLSRVEEMSWRSRHALCIGLLGCDLSEPSPESDAVLVMSRDANPQVRWCIANYLSRYRNGSRTGICLTLAADPSPWVRARLVTSLVGMAKDDPQSVLPLLERLASDSSSTVRLKMARDLSGLSHAPVRDALLGRLAEDVGEVGFAARYSLGLISDVHTSLSLPSGREVVLKVFRERVARRDLDVENARFSTVQTFVSERMDMPLGEDPYMHLVDTMCSLTAAAMTALRETPSAVEELMELLGQDADEAIRWALVLFLIRYSHPVPLSPTVRLGGLERLSRDPHWWIRREVANGLAEFQGGPQAAQAAQLLGRLHSSETRRAEPCGDEVFYFTGRSAGILRLPALLPPPPVHHLVLKEPGEPHEP
ncbi:HEAT repeat domain-containing protein [Streptomyces argenteolus]|uniref:HEAT repeat domain-containing protein n=1 Tax=Streptomyces argenteolus TaxID=67274 RepID=A0ABW6X5A8_9ACTN